MALKLEDLKPSYEGNPALRPIWTQLVTATIELKDYAVSLAIQARSGTMISEDDRSSFSSLKDKFQNAVSRLVGGAKVAGIEAPPEGDLSHKRVYATLRQLPS
ncbi:MAG: hypothetical protein G01um101420_661 [Parcubacteria group bacterium Gr01-1014_20]|nr:MAG: hypothetical protein G01um101420_661 [Parcubacteria group bacterium Gr01-1014_20]